MASTEPSGVAARYASALFELARDGNAIDSVEADVVRLRDMIAESDDLRRFIASPIYGAADQVKAMGALLDAAGITGLVANFTKLAAKNRRLFVLPAMLKAFETMVADYRGETLAKVTSAEPLSDAQRTTLEAALAEKAGGTVKLETRVDPSLIGGLIVQLGSQLIDTSVRTRLAGMRRAMKEAA